MGFSYQQSQGMSDDEILTITTVAAMLFCSNHQKARISLCEYHDVPNVLIKSHLNRMLSINSELMIVTRVKALRLIDCSILI